MGTGQRMSIFSLKTSGHPPLPLWVSGAVGMSRESQPLPFRYSNGSLKIRVNFANCPFTLPHTTSRRNCVKSSAGRQARGEMGGKETFSAQLNWTTALLSLFSAVSKSPASTSGNSARIFCKNKTLGEQTNLTLLEKLWLDIWCFDCYKPKLNNLSHRQADELPEARS